LPQALFATGDAATALRTVRVLSDSVLAGERELDLAARAAQKACDPAAAARLKAPQLAQLRKLAAQGEATLSRKDCTGAFCVYRQVPGHESDAKVLRRMVDASANAAQADAAIAYADKALALAPRNAEMLYIAGLVRL